MPLTDVAIRSAKPKDKPYKLADAQGMYLFVNSSGGKYWRLKYRVEGREKILSLGVYPEVTLGEAREKRTEARKRIKEGIDPSQAKQQEKQLTLLATTNSFEMVAREWHDSRKGGWTSRHALYVLRRLEADIFPALGQRPITNITAPELLTTVRKIESRGALDIAHRCLQTCGQVFRYAIAVGKAERNPKPDLQGSLKVPKKTHYSRLKVEELPEFLEKLKAYEGHPQTKLALHLLLLTFVRTGELRGATWNEIDFKEALWRIPKERMKMREAHIVPLSRQTLDVLEELKKLTGDKQFLFPQQNNPTKCMSENTLLFALYRMGYHSRATGHGFRGTASTFLNEAGFRHDVIERQLAHAERNKVRASYNHAEYLPERKEMMQKWADYLEGLVLDENTKDFE